MHRPPPAPMSAAVAAVMLTLMIGSQPVATDIYLPALPSLALTLGSPMSAVQLTLSAMIICFGLAQLVWGPLSDRFGRRPVLLAGLSLYTVASIGAMLAPNIAWLIGWRALQGVGMAAPVTCGRSIVRDLYEPREGARVMSLALGGLGLISLGGPVLGGLLAQAFGWRAPLALVALFGLGTLAWVAWRYPETLRQKNPAATQWRQLAVNWRRIARNRTFTAWAALLCATWGGLFLLLAASSFVFIEVLGVSSLGYGAALAATSFAYVCGTFLCRRLLLHGNAARAAGVGAVFSLTGGLSIAALSLAGVQTIWALIVPQLLYALGHGVHQPCGQSGAVSPFPHNAGTAASLAGCAMMIVAFVVSLWLGRSMNGTVYPMTLGLGFFGLCVAAVAWTLVRKHGDHRVLAPVRTA